MSEIRKNLLEAAIRAEVTHIEAGQKAKAAMRRLTDDERQTALIEASERVLTKIRKRLTDRHADGSELEDGTIIKSHLGPEPGVKRP
jgi:hypothetical protein